MDAKSKLYREYVFKIATSTHAQFPIFPEESWVTEIIQICIRYVWTGKFDLNADMCGKGEEKMRKGRKKWEIPLGSELALFFSFLVLKGHLHDSVILLL